MMFDSTVARGVTSTFPLDRVMAGWRECVILMTIGETRRCWVPQALAYNGRAGRPTGTVVFDIELIDFRGSPLIPPADVKAPPADAKRTASGLAYKVLRPGKGTRSPSPFSRVSVHYTGWTTDGRMFDSSVPRGVPTVMQLDEVIKGWSEGVPMMTEGERTRFSREPRLRRQRRRSARHAGLTSSCRDQYADGGRVLSGRAFRKPVQPKSQRPTTSNPSPNLGPRGLGRQLGVIGVGNWALGVVTCHVGIGPIAGGENALDGPALPSASGSSSSRLSLFDARAPPNGCWPMTAPVGLSLT